MYLISNLKSFDFFKHFLFVIFWVTKSNQVFFKTLFLNLMLSQKKTKPIAKINKIQANSFDMSTMS